MTKIVNLTEAKDLLASNELVIIDFFATWCGPCQMYGPIVDEVSSELTDVKIVKVDIDQDVDLAAENEVMGVPTTIAFKNGVEVARFSGFKPADELKAFIAENK